MPTEQMELIQTDEEILNQFRGGDSEAFNKLLKRYTNFIRHISSQFYCRGMSPSDLFQEGSVGLYKAVLRYDFNKGASFKSFAELNIRGNIINAMRTATRIKHSHMNTSVSLDAPIFMDSDLNYTYLDNVACSEPTPEESIIRDQDHKDKIKQFHKFMRDLSKLEKEVLVDWLKGSSHFDIAAKLGINAKSVDNALTRIKKKTMQQDKKNKTANPD